MAKKMLNRYCKAILDSKENLTEAHRAMLFMALGIRPKKTKTQAFKANQVISVKPSRQKLKCNSIVSEQVFGIIEKHGSITREQLEKEAAEVVQSKQEIGRCVTACLALLRRKNLVRVDNGASI